MDGTEVRHWNAHKVCMFIAPCLQLQAAAHHTLHKLVLHTSTEVSVVRVVLVEAQTVLVVVVALVEVEFSKELK